GRLTGSGSVSRLRRGGPAAPRPVGRARRLPVVLPLGVALGRVVLFFVRAGAVEQTRLQRDFARWAHTLADTLRQSLDGYLDALQAIESFYASAPEVRRQAFRTFVHSLGIFILCD